MGLILSKKLTKSVLSFWPKNKHILMVKLKFSPFNANTVVIYAPIADANEQEMNFTILEMMFTKLANQRKFLL